jgi:glycosyltransferase involved in cell wall biosynthesis
MKRDTESRSPVSKPIKVCHIAHGDLWAGAEVQLVTLLEGLVRDSRLELSAIVLNDGRLACEIKKLGVPVTVLSEEQYNSCRLFMNLVAILRRQRPELVHTHKYKDNILGTAAAAAVGIRNVVRVVHGMTEPFSGMAYIKMMGYESVDRLITRLKVKRLIAVSEDIESDLGRRYGVHKVVQIHNGINLRRVGVTQHREHMRRSIGFQSGDRVIGTVGRLTPVKGHNILLQAAGSLIRKRGNVKVLIVGDGPLKATLTQLVHDLRIEKEVVLAGQRDDVYDLVNCMDVFVLPSFHEGIPMVLLEALALKCPVVASRVGGIPEVVMHGVGGFLVSPGNAAELEQGLVRILEDELYAKSLAEAGRSRVEEEFSANVMAERTADLYCSLVSDRVHHVVA